MIPRLIITKVKARYVHGTGGATKQFHLINLGRVNAWHTPHSDEDPGWATLTLYTACGLRIGLVSARRWRRKSMTLATSPPAHLKPCPRCFARWEALGKPLSGEQWRESAHALRVMNGHAARAKVKK